MAKAGRVLSAKNEGALRSAHLQLVGAADEIKNVLSVFDDEAGKAAPAADSDQTKASGEPDAKSDASDEEPAGAKSPAPDEELKADPSVETWATALSLLALGHE